jgi:hypothetical protein
MNLERIKFVQKTRKIKMLCKICNRIISRGHLMIHEKSKIHNNNKIKNDYLDSINNSSV